MYYPNKNQPFIDKPNVSTGLGLANVRESIDYAHTPPVESYHTSNARRSTRYTSTATTGFGAYHQQNQAIPQDDGYSSYTTHWQDSTPDNQASSFRKEEQCYSGVNPYDQYAGAKTDHTIIGPSKGNEYMTPGNDLLSKTQPNTLGSENDTWSTNYGKGPMDTTQGNVSLVMKPPNANYFQPKKDLLPQPTQSKSTYLGTNYSQPCGYPEPHALPPVDKGFEKVKKIEDPILNDEYVSTNWPDEEMSPERSNNDGNSLKKDKSKNEYLDTKDKNIVDKVDKIPVYHSNESHINVLNIGRNFDMVKEENPLGDGEKILLYEDEEEGDVFKRKPVQIIRKEEPTFVKISLKYQETKASEISLPEWKYCNLCGIHFTDETAYHFHCKGMLHKKKETNISFGNDLKPPTSNVLNLPNQYFPKQDLHPIRQTPNANITQEAYMPLESGVPLVSSSRGKYQHKEEYRLYGNDQKRSRFDGGTFPINKSSSVQSYKQENLGHGDTIDNSVYPRPNQNNYGKSQSDSMVGPKTKEWKPQQGQIDQAKWLAQQLGLNHGYQNLMKEQQNQNENQTVSSVPQVEPDKKKEVAKKAPSRPKKSGEESYYCKLCDLKVQETNDWNQHIAGEKHNRTYLAKHFTLGMKEFENRYGDVSFTAHAGKEYQEPGSRIKKDKTGLFMKLVFRSATVNKYICRICSWACNNYKNFASHIAWKHHVDMYFETVDKLGIEKFLQEYGDVPLITPNNAVLNIGLREILMKRELSKKLKQENLAKKKTHVESKSKPAENKAAVKTPKDTDLRKTPTVANQKSIPVLMHRKPCKAQSVPNQDKKDKKDENIPKQHKIVGEIGDKVTAYLKEQREKGTPSSPQSKKADEKKIESKNNVKEQNQKKKEKPVESKGKIHNDHPRDKRSHSDTDNRRSRSIKSTDSKTDYQTGRTASYKNSEKHRQSRHDSRDRYTRRGERGDSAGNQQGGSRDSRDRIKGKGEPISRRNRSWERTSDRRENRSDWKETEIKPTKRDSGEKIDHSGRKRPKYLESDTGYGDVDKDKYPHGERSSYKSDDQRKVEVSDVNVKVTVTDKSHLDKNVDHKNSRRTKQRNGETYRRVAYRDSNDERDRFRTGSKDRVSNPYYEDDSESYASSSRDERGSVGDRGYDVDFDYRRGYKNDKRYDKDFRHSDQTRHHPQEDYTEREDIRDYRHGLTDNFNGRGDNGIDVDLRAQLDHQRHQTLHSGKGWGDTERNIEVDDKAMIDMKLAMKEFVYNLKVEQKKKKLTDAEVMASLGPDDQSIVLHIQKTTGINTLATIVTSLQLLSNMDPNVLHTLGSLESFEIQKLVQEEADAIGGIDGDEFGRIFGAVSNRQISENRMKSNEGYHSHGRDEWKHNFRRQSNWKR